MAITELRTYTLKSPEAAQEYAKHWQAHLTSLGKFNIEAKAVFTSRSNPKQVLALVQYRDGDDPAEVGKKYMESDDFKADMKGFDFGLFESVQTALLEPLGFSPFQ